MQRSAGIADQREQVLAVSGEALEFAQQLKGLARERNQVLDACLHASGGNPPLSALEIELLPSRLTKLARSYKEEEGEPQGDADDFATRIALDRAQQYSQTPRIGNAWAMADDGRLE